MNNKHPRYKWVVNKNKDCCVTCKRMKPEDMEKQMKVAVVAYAVDIITFGELQLLTKNIVHRYNRRYNHADLVVSANLLLKFYISGLIKILQHLDDRFITESEQS